MIPIDFDYYRPEALSQMPTALSRVHGRPFLFYGGGSEIISMARVGSIAPQAVIDVKAMPEFRKMALENGRLTIGAAVTLTEIAEANLFPLLSCTVSRIADHTNQCRITLGGNVCSTIAYREAVLPLLLCDATVTFCKDGQLREAPIAQAFDQRLRHAPDEAAVRFSVEEKYLAMPWVHAKRTRGDKIDYPIVTIAALKAPDGLRFALSGVLAYPFRDPKLEAVFSDSSCTAQARAEAIVAALPQPPVSDVLGAADWRAFQLKCALEDAIDRLEGRMP